MLIYPMSSGRNFDEILRLLEFDPADRQASGRDAGELEAGRRLHHRPVAQRTRPRKRNSRAAGRRVKPYLRTDPAAAGRASHRTRGIDQRAGVSLSRRPPSRPRADRPRRPAPARRSGCAAPMSHCSAFTARVAVERDPDQRAARQRPDEAAPLPLREQIAGVDEQARRRDRRDPEQLGRLRTPGASHAAGSARRRNSSPSETSGQP